ncbi:MAG: DUF3293 domain-containing protein [Janthinobacterium lividum]
MSGPAPARSARSVPPDASVVPADTVQAYRESDYRIAAVPPLVLRVDRASAALRALHAVHDVTSSVFLTACNPWGRLRDAEWNRQRQAELAVALRQQGFAVIDGIGRHPTNDWPGEPSFLVLGPDRAAALELGRRHEQNAVIWCDTDAVPRLLLLR